MRLFNIKCMCLVLITCPISILEPTTGSADSARGCVRNLTQYPVSFNFGLWNITHNTYWAGPTTSETWQGPDQPSHYHCVNAPSTHDITHHANNPKININIGSVGTFSFAPEWPNEAHIYEGQIYKFTVWENPALYHKTCKELANGKWYYQGNKGVCMTVDQW